MQTDIKNYTALRREYEEKCRTAGLPALTAAEKRMDARLAEMKRELRDACGGAVPADMPTLTDERLTGSELYAFCRELPKGADLHIHSLAVLPPDELIDFVCGRNDLIIGTLGEERGTLFASSDTGAGRLPLSEAFASNAITRSELRLLWRVDGAAEGENIWAWFEKLFNRHMALGAAEIIGDYYRAAFRYLYGCGIIHMELRQLFFGSHEDAQAVALAIRGAYYEFRREHPEFIVSIIGVGLKYTHLDMALTEMLLDNAAFLHENVKDEFDGGHICDFITGIDLVNEEDASRPLAEFAPLLSELHAKHPRLHIYLHAGESQLPQSDNIIDALLIGAERIGHGMNLYRYPALLDEVCRRNVCLEVCPMSNRTLHYVEDVRSHPAVEYLRRGVPMVLASDDPAYQEHIPLTDDFFAALVCWDIGAAELKLLCENSIKYSCLDELRRASLMAAHRAAWESFCEKF